IRSTRSDGDGLAHHHRRPQLFDAGCRARARLGHRNHWHADHIDAGLERAGLVHGATWRGSRDQLWWLDRIELRARADTGAIDLQELTNRSGLARSCPSTSRRTIGPIQCRDEGKDIMKRRNFIISGALSLGLVGATWSGAFGESASIISIPTPRGVQQPFILIKPDHAIASVILLAGGGGVLGLNRVSPPPVGAYAFV